MFVRIEESEAEKLALVLDSVEADLVGLQHRVFRVREALQRKAGKPCGHQYTEPNERGPRDDRAADLLATLKQLLKAYESVMPGIAFITVDDYALINDAPLAAERAIRVAEGKS